MEDQIKAMTKKQMAEINRMRKTNDNLKCTEQLQIEANLEELYTVMTTWNYRIKWLRGAMEINEKEIAKFAEDLIKDSYYAARWADGPMGAAAELHVQKIFLSILLERGPDVALRSARQEMERGARSPSHSTSSSANFVAQAELAAWAKLATEWRF